MNVRFMKMLDAVVGRLTALLLPPPQGVSSAEVRSILLIRPGGIGDAVLLIPAILAIKKRFTSAEITVLAESRNASVFTLCPIVDHVLSYDHPSGLVSTLRQSYDVVIDTEQWHRLSAVVARMTLAPMLIGYATNERARLFTHPIAYSHDDYESDSFQNLLAPFGVKPTQTAEKFLTVPADTASKVEELLESLNDRPFVSIFPGASIPERRWGAERFRWVAELLAAFGIAVVVVGGKGDKEQGEVIVSGGNGLNLAGRTSLPETAAVIEKSALLVSGDSGVLHIAVGLGKPTVSMFGPGRARKWAPQGGRHIVINREMPCSPCTTFGNTPPCPTDARCMKDITVDEVFNAVMMLLTAEKVVPSACCKKDWIEVSADR